MFVAENVVWSMVMIALAVLPACGSRGASAQSPTALCVCMDTKSAHRRWQSGGSVELFQQIESGNYVEEPSYRHRKRGVVGFGLRLRGGAQGFHIDAHEKDVEKSREAMRAGPTKEIIDIAMSLEHFPEELEPKPLQWPPSNDPIEWPERMQHPEFNENRIVYNPVGGEEKAYRGVGNAGMAVHSPRRWPYAVPEVVGHRSWKNATINGVKVHKRPSARACQVSLSTSWRQKMEMKEKKAALRGVMEKLRIKSVQAQEMERKRLQDRRRIKLQNMMKAEQYQVITNPRKIAKMTKKQRKGMRLIPNNPQRPPLPPGYQLPGNSVAVHPNLPSLYA